MKQFNFIATCLFGLEKTVSFELKKLGASDLKVSDGRIEFCGDATLLIDSNLWLRTAERVYIKLSTFKAFSFEELFENVKKINFEDYIGKNDSFPVKGWSVKSKLFSVSDCQSIIKKATVERLKSVYNINWFEESGPLHQICFSIHKDEVTIMLDTSGAGLHKRGYRKDADVAPIKETLASGIIDIVRVKSNRVLYDPFCGSGTFSIESCMKALNIAPGIYRTFSFESWGLISNDLISQRRQLAFSAINTSCEFKAFASDISRKCISLANANAHFLSDNNRISCEVRDIKDFKLKDDVKDSIIICNPPYGKRLLDIKESEYIYRVMGKRFIGLDANYCILSPHDEFEEFFGRLANKKRKLYNGMIKCNLYMYLKK